MALIKDIYSPQFYKNFTASLSQVLPSLDSKKFIREVFNNDFDGMEWKDRMKHTTRVLHTVMPADFPKAAKLIRKLIVQLRKDNAGDDALAYIFLPDYIETYGLEHLQVSVEAFEFITQFISCEFAVRPFILKYGQSMMDEMVKWSVHESYKVRRLASEGSRPRLPWAMALPELKKDPSPVLPILENLKNDPSESVRRSVANNLNDIAKDHPSVVIAIAKKWKGVTKETDAVIKHGARTLLKQGNPDVLRHYGLTGKDILLSGFDILTPKVKTGASLDFVFTITNDTRKARIIRLEYGIYYQKSKGHLARKVYKISERSFGAGEKCTIHKKQSFRIITTRKFHTGLHRLSIIVNGEEKGTKDFILT
ncbi:DNA alkylation repair protein [Ferruginibacter sp. HRS2-29]|uniref:DNA alkylation repair protein n=1 Tax=Ferruginibacter sp. HRS2-29 TaxID=2487334 RepID=UPI0020CFBAA1|nr:DNA alkylation repair protein [Ferruginibacter sp. HRS2-29]MCP9750418.1 DNA alkylation repair protein [Ferruginibacter sp. HRS2-29]